MGVTEKVRIAFELDKGDAQALCETLCEPKPSTAAAQVVRRYIRKGGEVIKPRDIKAMRNRRKSCHATSGKAAK